MGKRIREYDCARGSRQDAAAVAKWRADNPKKYKAHLAVAKAVRKGELINPRECEVCSSNNWIEAHHDDYNLPLQVRWLCAKCHAEWHMEHGEGLNSI